MIAKPKTCLLTVSNECHMQCKMCDLWKHETKAEEIRIDEAKKFIERLNAYCGKAIEYHFIGGETFVKKGIFDLIKHARKQGSRVVVTTSGYAITDEVADRIVASDVSMVNFSIESLTPSVHETMRGVHSHEKVMQAFQRLKTRSSSIDMAINAVICKINIHDIIALADWANEEERLSHIYFMAVMRPFGSDLGVDWYKGERGKELWPEEHSVVDGIIDQLIHRKKEGWKIGNSIAQFNVFKSYFKYPEKFAYPGGCTLDDRAINVNAIGDAYMCFFMEKLGNIKNDHPKKMWESQTAEHVRAAMKQCRRNCELVVNCYFEEGTDSALQ